MNNHELFMKQAIQLALDNVTSSKGGPFGAIITKNNEIIAAAGNQVTTTNDPSAHAEIVAIRKAAAKLGAFHLTGCTLYTSCEPCPMCFGAIYFAHIKEIYFACNKTDAQKAGFDDEYIYKQINLDYSQRDIPMKQIMQQESSEAFSLWQQSKEKICY
jgi:tRNA(Arg) A34 adenosine deaminase TadA